MGQLKHPSTVDYYAKHVCIVGVMADRQKQVPGLEPRSPLADHPPESIDELRILTQRLGTAVDELSERVREWQAKAGDETVQLHAQMQALDRRIGKIQNHTRRSTAKAVDDEVRLQAQIQALESRIGDIENQAKLAAPPLAAAAIADAASPRNDTDNARVARALKKSQAAPRRPKSTVKDKSAKMQAKRAERTTTERTQEAPAPDAQKPRNAADAARVSRALKKSQAAPRRPKPTAADEPKPQQAITDESAARARAELGRSLKAEHEQRLARQPDDGV
jgi:hypothetical protein